MTGPEEEFEERVAELRTDVPVERRLLASAIGGWRGMFDSGAPSAVFLVVYTVSGRALGPSLWAALGVGVCLAIYRLVRRQNLTQVAGGFLGVAVSAFVASRTGQAEDFFLPGLLTNAAYGLGALLSVLVGWPAMGLFVGASMGSPTAWRRVPGVRRPMATATWVWVGVFGGRLLVQLPMYLAGAVELLGVTKIVMGWPLFLLGAWLNYLIIRPVMPQLRGANAEAASPAQPASSSSSDDS